MSPTHLIGIVSSGGSGLALVTGGKFGQITVVVTLPINEIKITGLVGKERNGLHLVIKDL
jgi:hypothetical protein